MLPIVSLPDLRPLSTSLDDVVTQLRATIDALAARITLCECGQGSTKKLMALKANIAELRRDLDQLKSINMSMIFEKVAILNVSQMPPSTNGDEGRVEETIVP